MPLVFLFFAGAGVARTAAEGLTGTVAPVMCHTAGHGGLSSPPLLRLLAALEVLTDLGSNDGTLSSPLLLLPGFGVSLAAEVEGKGKCSSSGGTVARKASTCRVGDEVQAGGVS